MAGSCISAQLYSVRQYTQTPKDIAETFAKIKAIGYQAVQISGFGPYDANEVAKMLKDNDLICASTHVSFERLSEHTDEVIEELHLWECKHTAIASMPRDFHSPEGLIDFAKKAEHLGRKLSDAGITLSYHNHNFEFKKTAGKTWLEILYENADPAYLKAEIDTYWVQAGGGDPAEWITKLSGRVPALHLKDMVIGPDNKQRFAEIGEGNMNWSAILAAAEKAGVEWYCVEQDDCYERNPFDSLKISLENLQKMGLK